MENGSGGSAVIAGLAGFCGKVDAAGTAPDGSLARRPLPSRESRVPSPESRHFRVPSPESRQSRQSYALGCAFWYTCLSLSTEVWV